jgi:hypothetical protein
MWRGRRDSNANDESASRPGDSAASSSGRDFKATPSDTHSRPFETVGSKIGDAELVDAAAYAMLNGRGELAEFLMREVLQRRDPRRALARPGAGCRQATTLAR